MRVFSAVFCALVLALALAPARVPADSVSDAAPVDEYFGRLKLSPLGVRNELHLLEHRADADPAHADQIFHMTDLIEDSIRDWQKHYPRDSWIPERLRLLVEVYTHVHTPEGLLRAHHALAWLLSVTINGTDADRAILLLANSLRAGLPTPASTGSSITVKSVEFPDATATPTAPPSDLPESAPTRSPAF